MAYIDDIRKQTQYLADKLNDCIPDLEESASYYEALFRVRSIGLSTPPELRVLATAMGWPRMYVDALVARLKLKSFRASGRTKDKPEDGTETAVRSINDWFQANNLDEEHILGTLEALIYGRAYITISKPDPKDKLADQTVPVIRVESPMHLYAETDPRTNKVTRAIRLYKSEQSGVKFQWATLYLPNETVYLRHQNNQWVIESRDQHRLGVVPVVPLVNRERLADRLGSSQITPEIRSMTDAGQRTLMNMQAAMEIMALPPRLIFGVEKEEIVETDDDGNPLPGAAFDAYMGRILAIENESGKAFQFQAAELRNFTEVLDQLAKHIASYTGLPPQYLAFSSDNPASAEAINASESRLVRTCEQIASAFGGDWEQAMLVACIVMGVPITPALRRLESDWDNPATPTYASVVDAATKGYANGRGILPRERTWLDIGYSDEERQEMRDWFEEEDLKAAKELREMMKYSDVPGDQQNDSSPPEPANAA